MKKLGTIFCLSSALFASSMVQGWEGNWLVGASAGYADLEGHLNMTLGQAGQTNFRGDFGHSGFSGGLFGGYQALCENWLFGLELNLAWQNKGDTQHFDFSDAQGLGWAASMHYKRDTILGLTGRAGYKIARCILPYLRFGVQGSHDKLHLDAATSPASFSFDIDGSRTVYCLIGGIGVEVPVPRVANLSLRAEYDYTARGRAVNAKGNIISTTNLATGFAGGDMKPYNNSGNIAVVWNFA